MPVDTPFIRLAEDCVASELRPVVADHHFRHASVRDDPVKLPSDPLARQRRVGDQASAFPGANTEANQNPEPEISRPI